MRLTKEQAAENRSAIIEAAGRLFRERGFDSVSVADLMDAAGFTHGGFYNHFPSKEALAREAAFAGVKRSTDTLPSCTGASKASMEEVVRGYLSPSHRDNPGAGCTVAALAGDAGRQGKDVQEPFKESIERSVAATARELLQRSGAKGKRAEAAAKTKALRIWNEIVGALIMSRAVIATSPELSDAILAASREGCTKDLGGK